MNGDRKAAPRGKGVVRDLLMTFPMILRTVRRRAATGVLVAGCAVVLKPAEQTSLSVLRLADLFESCGFPPGMIDSSGRRR